MAPGRAVAVPAAPEVPAPELVVLEPVVPGVAEPDQELAGPAVRVPAAQALA